MPTKIPFARLVLAAVTASCLSLPTFAAEVFDRIKTQGVLKVCIWTDYYGITYRNPRTQQLQGIDIELSAELGKDLGVRIDYVESSFATLIPDLLGDKCDVGMFAIGVLPQRQEKLRFTQPYLRSDIYAITTKSNATVRTWADIDKPGVFIGVQQSTFMEPVMNAQVKHGTVVSIKPPTTREKELMAGRIDVFMTDYPYSRRLLDNADWARLIAPETPFHVMPYAYAVRPDDSEWLAYMNQFVAQIKRDGRLERAARNHGLSPLVVK
jgi:ABC-type amino acid transport substrate-binding protein